MIRVVNVRDLRAPEQRAGICYVGRNFAGWPGTPWRNPYRGVDRETCLRRFREYAQKQPREWLEKLWEACEHGKQPLGCWCVNAVHGDGKPIVCHAQILAEMLATLTEVKP